MLWPIFSNNSQFNCRLDFIAFTLAAPDSSAKSSAGQCLVDVFTVTGQSNSVPAICGSNANQHSNIFFLTFLFFFARTVVYFLLLSGFRVLVYMIMTPGTSTFGLNMILTGTSTSRLWNIRITQIPCGATYAG